MFEVRVNTAADFDANANDGLLAPGADSNVAEIAFNGALVRFRTDFSPDKEDGDGKIDMARFTKDVRFGRRGRQRREHAQCWLHRYSRL